ncbi:protein of unknown function [Cupriavidus taiwanensis]|uniref:Uncharacterized protein n=1 Tax=Cupriavidus taiwanensis TaxID=164546 RepID=A0A375BUQ7_9BURK|nr:hypothetical protein CBM2589_B30065 [Cupriavidus taiwanensis]SPK73645.1 protein of unknown function [Cupriavidus taiwanensis]
MHLIRSNGAITIYVHGPHDSRIVA